MAGLGASMAEEAEGRDSGAEASGAGVDPAAAALALSGASREEADAFLNDQRTILHKQGALIEDQRRHLHEQLKRLKIGVISDRLSIMLKVLTGIVGVGVAGVFALMVWDAAHSSGLIVEPFAVPSDMAARGLTGQVVASQMLDKLSAMQDITYSSRPPQPYENNWGTNLKVEIPETGVSIDELQQFLKDWLGHDTHITGEVYRTGAGIAVTAREGSEAGATFTGPESDLDGLMQQAAEHVYSVTQPFRYANYLDRDLNAPDIADRAARASVIYRQLIAGPNVQEQAWAWYGLAFIENFIKHDPRAAVPYLLKSVAANPDMTLSNFFLGNLEFNTLRHQEQALTFYQKAKLLLARNNVPDIDPRQLLLRRLSMNTRVADAKGDYLEGLRNNRLATDAPEFFDNAAMSRAGYVGDALVDLARLHDGRGIRVYLLDQGISSVQERFSGLIVLEVFDALDDWPAIVQFEKVSPERASRGLFGSRNDTQTIFVALAQAHMGDFGDAEALIAQSPTDCDDCVIVRGQVADLQGQHARADNWFQQAEKSESSIPFADTAWGQALLDRGQPDAAIEKFKLANQKGPKFADPLEGWGEALMKKNRSDLALAKFEEAEKYAPKWGRLHLKWGEALFYAGRKDNAQKQFAIAAGLDMSNDDKAELAKQPLHG
jgi:tetratricopeptide (TPR) repeat protein